MYFSLNNCFISLCSTTVKGSLLRWHQTLVVFRETQRPEATLRQDIRKHAPSMGFATISNMVCYRSKAVTTAKFLKSWFL